MKSLQRTIRRQVLIFLGILLLCQLFLAVAIDQGPAALRDPEYHGLMERWQKVRQNATHRQTVMLLGSSRTAYGFAAGQISHNTPQQFFNFGLPGAGPIYQFMVLQRLVAANLLPDRLVIELLPAFFHADFAGREPTMIDGARYSYQELQQLRQQSSDAGNPVRKWLTARLFPTGRHLREVQQYLGISTESASVFHGVDSHGWQPRYDERLQANRAALTQIAHRQYGATYQQFRPHLPSYRLVYAMAKLAYTNGCRVVFYLPPESSEFVKLYEPTWDQTLHLLVKNPLLPVIDARCWVTDDGFYDGHHLLKQGAMQFSERFPHVLNADLWREWLDPQTCLESLTEIPAELQRMAR